METHDRMESVADVYVAGGLSADERRDVDQHASACAACAALLRDAREFSAWAKGAIAADAPPSDLEERVVERFRAAGQSKKRRFIVGKRILKVTGSVAAAIALIFLGNLFSARGQGDSAGEVSRQTKGKDSNESYYRADRAGQEDPKARAIREAYEDQLGRDKQELAIRALSPETEMVVDEFRRQRGWNFIIDPSNKDGASTGKPYTYFGWMEGEGKERDLGLIPESRTRTGADFSLQEPSNKLAELAKLEDKHTELARDKKQLEEKTAVLAQAGEALTAAPAKAQNQLGGLDFEKNNLAKFGERGGTSATILKVEPQKPQTPAPVQDNRKIIRSADVGLEVDSYDATSTKLSEFVAAEKGFVASANTQKMANGKIQATVVVRIPPDRFDAVVARLKEFGTIRYQNLGSDDVTKAYVDLESRLKGKEILAERLRKLLAEGKGTVKELMEVEVQLGNTNEAIERIKGEIKFYDNRIGLSTLTLQIAEKDLGQPFEYVQTLQANLALTARDPDAAYAQAQKEILGVGGQVVDSRMSRQNDGSSTGTIRARVEADKFNALRETLRKLGFPTNDTVNVQKSAHGGQEGTPKVDAPLRKELASLDLTISSPPLFVTHKSQLLVESPAVESAYQNARKVIEAAGGKIVDGALAGRGDRMQGALRAQVDADKFAGLVESLKTAGTLKNANVNHLLPTVTPEGVPLLRERAEIEFTVVSPPQLIGEEHGLVKTIRDTFANSWSGLLWSIEKLFVGVSLAGPWILLLAVGVLGWKKFRRKKAVSSQ